MVRLLNVHTLELEDIDESRYLILSHRWGTEEISFMDMKDKKLTLGRKRGRERSRGSAKWPQAKNTTMCGSTHAAQINQAAPGLGTQ